MADIYEKMETALLAKDYATKRAILDELLPITREAAQKGESFGEGSHPPIDIPMAGIPEKVKIVDFSELKQRSYMKDEGYGALLHSVCHIEFNAINLGLDAAYRFRDISPEFTFDWIEVAHDECRHFELMHDRLKELGKEYGDYPAHGQLWEMCVKTAHDSLVRMALVPRVLEARGLDVTPGMIEKMKNRGDKKVIAALEVIYTEEIGHVKKGNKWYNRLAQERGVDPMEFFKDLIKQYDMFVFRGYVNLEGRIEAGFTKFELELLQKFVEDRKHGVE